MKQGTHADTCAKAADHQLGCTCDLAENYEKQKIVMRAPNSCDAKFIAPGVAAPFALELSTIGFGSLYKELESLASREQLKNGDFLWDLWQGMIAVQKAMRGEQS